MYTLKTGRDTENVTGAGVRGLACGGRGQVEVASLGLPVDGAVVLQNSNKLTVRLLPGDVLARMAPGANTSPRWKSSWPGG